MEKLKEEEEEEDWLSVHYPTELKRRRLKKMEEELEEEVAKQKAAEKEEAKKMAEEAVQRLDVVIARMKEELEAAEKVKDEMR